MNIKQTANGILLTGETAFSPSLCLDCGQAFRWEERDGVWHGVAMDHVLDLQQTPDGILFYTTMHDFQHIWYDYFDLGRDYASILQVLQQDVHLKRALQEFPGIRILAQDPWEALCSFILSQNNNIPRIKGIIKRLCANFGQPLGHGDFTFPSAQVLSHLTLDDLAPLRAGFRNKYLLDAAQKVVSGEVRLAQLAALPLAAAREELMRIKGVGVKVAECTLLYGCRHIDAFPIDVWVNRILSELYVDGLPHCTNGVEGIAQQYLFHWRRNAVQFQSVVQPDHTYKRA